MASPVREQTDLVRKAFKDAGYDIGKRSEEGLGVRPFLLSCHSSWLRINEVPCIETFVDTPTPGGHFWKSPEQILERLAHAGLTGWQHGEADVMLQALGRRTAEQLVERIDESKYSVTIPVPDAMLPAQLWAPTDVRVVEAKRALIRVEEAIAGWTVVAEHKTATVRGKPQTYRMQVRRCGCTERLGRAPKFCRCVLRPQAPLSTAARKHESGPHICCHRGHRETVDAFVGYLAETYR
ncbi:hypothetical protein BAY59_10870 [Prauserella coralliicola]|nr:hypothetical protein BAY59_10870 [Prauserella coralliicola]